MPETELGRYEHPPAEYPLWYRKGLHRNELSEPARKNLPPDIIDQQYDGYVDWLEQQEIQITGVVQQWIDLPDPDPAVVVDGTTPEGENADQRRRYFVYEDKVVVYDTGAEWEIVYGLGSAEHPTPEMHTQDANAETGTINYLTSTNTNTEILRKNGNHVYAPQLIENFSLEAPATLDTTIDTTDFDGGRVIVKGEFRTTSTRGPEDIKMRVASYDGAQYRQTNMSGSGINTPPDATEWTLGTVDLEFGCFSCSYEITRPRNRPLIHGTGSSGSGAFSDPILQKGAVVGGDVFRITSVDFFSTGEITEAEIEVYGKSHGQV